MVLSMAMMFGGQHYSKSINGNIWPLPMIYRQLHRSCISTELEVTPKESLQLLAYFRWIYLLKTNVNIES